MAAAVGLPAVGQDDRQRAAAVRRRRSSASAWSPRSPPDGCSFCQGFSEPDAGSDLASLRTRARRDGDRFVVSGRKIWTSSAEYADWVYLAVRTDPDRERHRGLSVLVADINTPGITVSTHRTLGGGTIGELELDEVEIPADQLVGELHGGWRVLMGTLDYERVTSEKVGTVFWLLDALAPLAQDRHSRRDAEPAARSRAGGPAAWTPRGASCSKQVGPPAPRARWRSCRSPS